MEPKETTIQSTAESVVKTVEVGSATNKNTIAAEAPVVSVLEPKIPKPEISELKTSSITAPRETNPTEIATPQMTNELWQQVMQTWEEYFGEGKKSNLTIAIIIVATIPLLIVASGLLDFLNKLPLLPSVFELVGFGYSVWFVYRYLLLATRRKELTDAIAAWKNQIFG
jgi:hypothetical protein